MIKYISTKQDKERYETFVGHHPKGHFVKSLKWAEFKKPWRFEVFVSVNDAGDILGSMLIMISRVSKTRFAHMYCPRGPVVDDHDLDTLSELAEEARRLAKKYHAYELAIDPDITCEDDYLNDLIKVGFVVNNTRHRPEYLQARYVFRLPIEGRTADEIFADFHSKTRYNVRLSAKKGVTCRIGGREDLPAFHSIMKETAVRDGFIARSLKYFEDMYDALAPENLRLYLIEYENVAIAGAIALYFGDKLWYLYGASGNRERNRMPNYLMQWEMIRWSVELGCTLYDFRGVTGDMEKRVLDGLIRFKSGFGGKQVDFVGRLSMIFSPRAAKNIESAQSLYRALIRKIQVVKSKLM